MKSIKIYDIQVWMEGLLIITSIMLPPKQQQISGRKITPMITF